MDNRPSSTEEWLTKVATRGKELSSKRNRRREILISGTTLLIIVFTVFSFTVFNNKDTNKNKVIKTVEVVDVTSTAVPAPISTEVPAPISTEVTTTSLVTETTKLNCYKSTNEACGPVKMNGELPSGEGSTVDKFEISDNTLIQGENVPNNKLVTVSITGDVISSDLDIYRSFAITKTCVAVTLSKEGSSHELLSGVVCSDERLIDWASFHEQPRLCVTGFSLDPRRGTWPLPEIKSATASATFWLDAQESGTYDIKVYDAAHCYLGHGMSYVPLAIKTVTFP